MTVQKSHFDSAMKKCSKCLLEKPLSAFYLKDSATKRLSSRCKACDMDSVKAYRASHLEYFRQIDKRRGMMPHRVSAREAWQNNHPERRRANQVVQNAVKFGRLSPHPCFVCGEKAEAHHPDYSAPLDVVWLCRFHHKQAHALVRKAA